ncbi:MAG: asparagine synthase (glutamine-hydrolyzing) [Bacteroidia bacterium]
MCGIAGFIDPTISTEAAEKTIASMLQSIAHRGPDATSSWVHMPVVFGHNRLSIIDLSDEATQPMHFFGLSIVFNGEIYNYLEVREELIAKGYKFSTASDTEVILAAYREYGQDAVKKLVGMWALAIWDEEKKEMFCSRDRFGIKPFYYIHSGQRFYFGSEYKVLKKSPLFSNDINLNQISRGLQLGWVCYEDETYYSSLKSLPAACNLIVRNDQIEIIRYWDIQPDQQISITEEEAAVKFRNLFEDSIRLHMRADVEVGGCLSGGLDSSAIASVVSKLFPEIPFKTFTIYFDGKNEVDERPWVNEVLQKYRQLKSFTYSPDENDLKAEYERAFYHADVPLAGSSPVSQYFVMKLAAQQKIKVLLDGQGSDEYLAGYMHSFYRLIGGLFQKMKLSEAHREFYAHSAIQGFSAGKKADAFAKSLLSAMKCEQDLYALEYTSYFPFAMKDKKVNFNLRRNGAGKLNEFLYHLTFNTSLPSLLHYEDRNSMAFSIESRVPFLDHRLVEYVFSLPDSLKFKQGITKSVLRKSLDGILPKSISERTDKKGFVTPGEVKWLRGPLSQLLDFDFKRNDFLKESLVKEEIARFKNGENKNSVFVWRLATLNYWMKND